MVVRDPYILEGLALFPAMIGTQSAFRMCGYPVSSLLSTNSEVPDFWYPTDSGSGAEIQYNVFRQICPSGWMAGKPMMHHYLQQNDFQSTGVLKSIQWARKLLKSFPFEGIMRKSYGFDIVWQASLDAAVASCFAQRDENKNLSWANCPQSRLRTSVNSEYL